MSQRILMTVKNYKMESLAGFGRVYEVEVNIFTDELQFRGHLRGQQVEML